MYIVISEHRHLALTSVIHFSTNNLIEAEYYALLLSMTKNGDDWRISVYSVTDTPYFICSFDSILKSVKYASTTNVPTYVNEYGFYIVVCHINKNL